MDTNQLMELTLDDKEGKEKFSPSFNQSNPIDFSKLIDHFRKCQTEVLFHFFAFLNILLGHTYNNSQNKFSESLYMTFLCDSYIKEKYYEYINNWGNYQSPIGMKGEFISYDQLPKIIENFRVFQGLPHQWINSIAQKYHYGSHHYDKLTNIYELYLEYEPRFAVEILEKVFNELDFINKIKSIKLEKEIHTFEKPVRLGQALIGNLFFEMSIKYLPDFIQALTNSSNLWIKQKGFICYFLYRESFLNSIKNDLRNIVRQTNLLSDKVTDEEKASLDFGVYWNLLNDLITGNHVKNFDEDILHQSRISFSSYISRQIDPVNSIEDFLFKSSNRIETLIIIIHDLKIFLPQEQIIQISENLVLKAIISKIEAKKDRNNRKGFLYLENIDYKSLFSLLKNIATLKKKVVSVIDDYYKFSLRMFNDPFILRKDLSLVWLLTEGLAWCVYFLIILKFDAEKIKQFENLMMMYYDEKGNNYYDWPDLGKLYNDE